MAGEPGSGCRDRAAAAYRPIARTGSGKCSYRLIRRLDEIRLQNLSSIPARQADRMDGSGIRGVELATDGAGSMLSNPAPGAQVGPRSGVKRGSKRQLLPPPLNGRE